MLKESKKIKHLNQLITKAHQMAPNPITSLSVFSPPQFSFQQKSLSRTQPITLKATSKHKKSASTTKYQLGKKDETDTKTIHLQNQDVVKIIEESENLIKNNELIEGINLLKALKDPAIHFHNPELKLVLLMNLAIAYYQTGFLEQAFEEFNALSLVLNNAVISSTKPTHKLLCSTLQGKVQLQICILFSEMGKHEEALKHANNSCKIHFELIYDLLTSLAKQLLAKAKSSDKPTDLTDEKNLANNVLVLEHLHKLVGDLNQIFHIPHKIKLSKQLLNDLRTTIPGYQHLKIDMEVLFNDEDTEPNLKPTKSVDWIFTHKILDQIQLKSLSPTFFNQQFALTNPEIVQRITYLAISFYCYSTQIRFIQKNNFTADQNQVLDSQHWLSRSLEIAYSFMPPNAPILNQILTVHDRFHGIDKQTIPEDKQIEGYFKVLKPLSKPKSTYSSKSHISSPIMIRIQAPKITIDLTNDTDKYHKINHENQKANVFDLDALTKNNKIKGLNTRIKILEFSDVKHNDTLRTIRLPNSSSPSTKISSRNTISDLTSLQSQRQKKIRISKIYHTNRKTIEGSFRDDPKSMCELQGKAIISEDLLHRPLSYEKNVNKWEKIEATNKAYSTHNAKRRKSLPSRNKEKLEKIVYNGSVKLDGLKLTGKKLSETFEIDQSFLQKLSEAHQNEQSLISNNKGANIFINNNINLYISKGQEFPKTSRVSGQVKEELSKRQKFINKRRLSHLNIYPTQEFNL